MARKVFISSSMSVDEKLIDVAEQDQTAALMWPWVLTVFDDWGRAEANIKKLKALTFPAMQNITYDVIENALTLYDAVGLIELYEVDGKRYMAVPLEKWYKYQTHMNRKNRRPGADKLSSDFPAPQESPQIPTGPRGAPWCPVPSPSPSPSPLPLKELKDKECNFASNDASPSHKDNLDSSLSGKAPVDEIVELYNSTCTSLPKVQKVTDKRKREIRMRWKSYPDLETFRRLFQKAQESDFLSGRSGRWTGCNFDWLLKEANMVKVLEGCYDNRGSPAVGGMAQPTSDEKFAEEARIIEEEFGGDTREYGFWISEGRPPLDEWRSGKHRSQRYYAQH